MSAARKFLRLVILWGFCGLLPLASCTQRETLKAPTSAETVVVFVPGFKGSALVSHHSQKTRWITALQAWGMGSPLTYGKETLTPSSVLRRVDAIPHLIGIDAYGKTLAYFEKALGDRQRVIPFAYDWREDLGLSANRLAEKIQGLKKDGKRVILVAHSMGGLVAAYYLRYGRSSLNQAVENWEGLGQVDAVIFAGTPFSGTVEVFVNLQIGIQTFLDRDLLNAKALGSFPSVYQLLPYPGTESVFVGKEALPLNLFDADHWTQRAWGTIDRWPQATRAHIARAQYFFSLLHADVRSPPANPPPILNIIGISRPTPDRVYWISKDIFYYREKHLSKTDKKHGLFVNKKGDGLITEQSAALPASWKNAMTVETAQTTHSHGNLFKDKDMQIKISDLIRSVEQR